jgi:hypothetical protein
MMDAPSTRDLTLYRLSAAGDENERLAVLLRACGLTVSSIAAELQAAHGWRDVEVAIALSEMLDQIKNQVFEQLMS